MIEILYYTSNRIFLEAIPPQRERCTILYNYLPKFTLIHFFFIPLTRANCSSLLFLIRAVSPASTFARLPLPFLGRVPVRVEGSGVRGSLPLSPQTAIL